MWQLILEDFIGLWVVIDPIGTIPVFIAVTKSLTPEQRRNTAITLPPLISFDCWFFCQ